jgi:hypothetical protein
MGFSKGKPAPYKKRGNCGYQGSGYATCEIGGKDARVPVSRIKIIPPQGGTAAAMPFWKNKQK